MLNDFSYIWQIYLQEYETDLMDFYNETMHDTLSVSLNINSLLKQIAVDTLRLAKYYCPVETGALRDSLTLSLTPEGFIIYSDFDYAGYVHEIMRYRHDKPTKAGFLILAFKEVMARCMTHLGFQNVPDFSVSMSYNPFFLTIYGGDRFTPGFISLRQPQELKDFRPYTDNVQSVAELIAKSDDWLFDSYAPSASSTVSSDSGYKRSDAVSWTKYFNPEMKAPKVESKNILLEVLEDMRSHGVKVATPDTITDAVNRLYINKSFISKFKVPGLSKKLEAFDEINK